MKLTEFKNLSCKAALELVYLQNVKLAKRVEVDRLFIGGLVLWNTVQFILLVFKFYVQTN